MKLNTYFSSFHTRISLDSTRVERIKSAHSSLREILSQDEEIKDIFLDSFLQGSYAIGTALRPKEDEEFDVDVVLALNIAQKYGYLPDGTQVNDWLLKRVTSYEKYKDKAAANNKRVRIDYVDGFHIDLLPAHCDGDPTPGVLVPPIWDLSNPIGYKEWCQTKNDSTGGRFTRVTKYLKWWRNSTLGQDSQLKSIILTTIVGTHMNEEFSSDAEALVNCMEFVANELKYQYVVPTIWNPSLPIGRENIARDWGQADFESFKTEFLKATETAQAAFDEEDREKCVTLWASIFGDEFEGSVVEEVKEMSSAIREARAIVSSSLFLSSTRGSNGGVPVKPVRQYGD